MQADHIKMANVVNARVYPEVIYALSYQDGLQDALKRALTLMPTGYYSDAENCRRTVRSYLENVRPQKLRQGRYTDVAYIDGYVDGVLYHIMPDDVRKDASIYYMFGCKEHITNLKRFKKLLKHAPQFHRKAHRHAQDIVSKANLGDGIIFHHQPRLF